MALRELLEAAHAEENKALRWAELFGAINPYQ